MPNNAAPRKKVVAAAALKPVERNSRRSISGRSTCRLCPMNRPTSASPARIGPNAIRCVIPPCVSVSDRPNTIPVRPGHKSAAPSQSSLPASTRPASGLSTRAARRIAAPAIGTFTTKIHCQEALSTIRPPMIGPKIGPSRIGTPTAASARPTRRGPALCAIRVKPTGISIPPPRPWRIRNAISSPAEVANAHSAEPSANKAIEAIQVRFEPNRSVSQPERGITAASESRYPVETHWMLLSGECNSRERVSSATLTIVVSSTAMISPSVATPATTSVE